MPLRITILSGDRQGQQLEFDQEVIEIGGRATDDVRFDPSSNPGIANRNVTLKWQNGGWMVYSSGGGPVFLNQDTVHESTELKSGDFLRLSHDGPDLSCEFIGQLSPVATLVPGAKAAGAAESNATAMSAGNANEENPGPAAAATSRQSQSPVGPAGPAFAVTQSSAVTRNLWVAIVAGVGVVALIGLAVPAILWSFSRSSPTPAAQPELVPFGVIVVEEGKQVFWRPVLRQADPTDRFELGADAPPEMTIDELTGTVRWQTSEQDGPGEFRCQLTVRRGDDPSQSDADWLEIKVEEVNQPPRAESLKSQLVDLRTTRDLQVSLRATDTDVPKQTLTFHLGAEAPEGVELDSQTGVLRWQIGEQFANREIMIPYHVTDSRGARSVDNVLRVRVQKPDPWDVAQQQLRECIYMVVTETTPGKLIVPLGTAVAVSEKQLLTTASVGHGINDARGRGWKVLAIDTRDFDLLDPQGWSITRVQSHAAHVRAESIQDPQQRGLQQAFFDLSLITTDQSLPTTCVLGDLEATVKNDQTLACFGFEVEGDALSRFDTLEPFFTKLKVLAVVPPPTEAAIQGRPPFLLQLVGQLPIQPFGSVIFDDRGEVLGVYAFEGELPDDVEFESIHYAVDTVHAKAFLAQQGLDLWIETQPIKPDAGNQ